MKNLVTLISIFLLTHLSAYSQITSPEKIVVGTDTGAVISLDDIRTINIVFVGRDECFETRDSLYSIINSCDSLISTQNSMMRVLDNQLAIKGQIINNDAAIILNLESTVKSQKRRIKWLQIKPYIFVGAAIVGYSALK